MVEENKILFNLELRNHYKKAITKLKRNDGTELNSWSDILGDEETIYRNLYSSDIVTLGKKN